MDRSSDTFGDAAAEMPGIPEQDTTEYNPDLDEDFFLDFPEELIRLLRASE